MFDQFNLTAWVATMGYVGILSIVFLETAVFFCFFLPGDSLLFAAGLLSAKSIFKLSFLIPAVAAVAFLGYMIAYWFGIRLGHWLMNRPDSFWFKKQYMIKSHEFYEKHGGKALIIGRLVPVIRTFIPIVAGMAEMSYKRYTLFNFLGAILWASVLPIAGYTIGSVIPDSQKYILPIILLVVLLSISPAIYKWWKHRKSS